MSVVRDFTQHLENQGIGTIQTDLFYGRMPDLPNLCVSVQDLPGGSPDYVIDSTSPLYERYRIVVHVRAGDYATAEAKAEAVKTAVLPLLRETKVGDTTFFKVTQSSTPWNSGFDARERPAFQQTFEVLVRKQE